MKNKGDVTMRIPLVKKYRRNVTRYLRQNPDCPVSAAIAYALAKNRRTRGLALEQHAATRRGRAMLGAIVVVTGLPRPHYLNA